MNQFLNDAFCKLYKKWLTKKDSASDAKYKNYRKIYNKMLRAAETVYYHKQFDNKTSTIKQLWNNFNTVYSFSKHSKKQSGISKLISNKNTLITDPKDISNYFNNYFCSIGDVAGVLLFYCIVRHVS